MPTDTSPPEPVGLVITLDPSAATSAIGNPAGHEGTSEKNE